MRRQCVLGSLFLPLSFMRAWVQDYLSLIMPSDEMFLLHFVVRSEIYYAD